MCSEGDNERYYSGLETQGQFRYRYKHPPKPTDSYTYSQSHPWGGLKSSLLLSFFFSSRLLMSSASHFFPFKIQFAIRDAVLASCRPHGHLFFKIFFFFFSCFVCLIPFCCRSRLRVPPLCLKETGEDPAWDGSCFGAVAWIRREPLYFLDCTTSRVVRVCRN